MADLARWRVPLGYPVAVAVLWFARPNPRSVAAGALVAALGLLVRALAAGCLQKQEALTVSGPYAYTRNPLYLGSSLLAAGCAVACRSWYSVVILAAYLASVYPAVMRREEREMRAQFGHAFGLYAARVPLFLPRLTPARLAGAGDAMPQGRRGRTQPAFSWKQYARNREYEAAIGVASVVGILYLLMRWRGH
jgi:hypothetical protein